MTSLIIEKIVENRFKYFGHLEERLVGYVAGEQIRCREVKYLEGDENLERP